jgi:hypothetical protein
MPQGYVGPLAALQADGPALATSSTATSLLNAQAKYTLGTNFIDVIGKQFLILAHGRISTLTATPGTFTVDLRLGSVVVANGGAMTLSTTAKTNVSWFLFWLLTCRAIGAGGSATANFMHQGMFMSEAIAATTIAGIAQCCALPQSAPAVGTSFDPAAAEQWDMFGTWQTSSASNSIQTHGFQVLSLN